MMTTLSDSLLTVPLLPPKHVSRPRLLADLDRAAGLPLTLLCAGPGAGKTVLLTEWAQNSKAPVAWITPGQADDEPRRFFDLLESALPAQVLPESPLPGSAPPEPAWPAARGKEHGRVVVTLPDARPDPAQLLLDRMTGTASAGPLAVI